MKRYKEDEDKWKGLSQKEVNSCLPVRKKSWGEQLTGLGGLGFESDAHSPEGATETEHMVGGALCAGGPLMFPKIPA